MRLWESGHRTTAWGRMAQGFRAAPTQPAHQGAVGQGVRTIFRDRPALGRYPRAGETDGRNSRLPHWPRAAENVQDQPAAAPSGEEAAAGETEQDCPFPVVFLQHPWGRGLWCRRVSILGHICYVTWASFHKSHYLRVAGNVHASRPEPKSLSGTEFVLCKLPLDGWLVIPRANYRLAIFRLWTQEPTSRWTGPWDLNLALNAWHLIEGAPLPEGGPRQTAEDSRQSAVGSQQADSFRVGISRCH